MKTEKFDSVWDAIEDATEAAENMKLRSESSNFQRILPMSSR